MSEYQWIHFIACDRPLDDEALEFMHQQSTRASITRWEFTNEYHFGDFRGDAAEMLRRGYDMHLHYANFGIRKIMFRLPQLPCDRKTFKAFEVEYGIEWEQDEKSKAGLLTIEPEADAGTYDSEYWEDLEGLIHRLAPLRDMLIRGDLRPLYLAWLACCDQPDRLEPPVPAGLAEDDPALDALAEFYEVPQALIEAAGQSAPDAAPPSSESGREAVARWLCKQSGDRLRQIAEELLLGDPAAVKAGLLAELRDAGKEQTWPLAKPTRTFEQLCEVAEELAEQHKRERAEAQRRARQEQLRQIAANPQLTIRTIHGLIEKRSTTAYEKAAKLLGDLAEALGPDKGPAEAQRIAQQLRKKYPTRRHLISALKKAGWLG